MGKCCSLHQKEPTEKDIEQNRQLLDPENSGSIRLVAGSCIYQHKKDQPLWQHMLRSEPDLLLLLGDNVYLDIKHSEEKSKDTKHMKYFNLYYNEVDWYKEPLKQYDILLNHKDFVLNNIEEYPNTKEIPKLLIWDDHDFGVDNADGNFKYKDITKDGCLYFWNKLNLIPKDQQINDIIIKLKRNKNDGIFWYYDYEKIINVNDMKHNHNNNNNNADDNHHNHDLKHRLSFHRHKKNNNDNDQKNNGFNNRYQQKRNYKTIKIRIYGLDSRWYKNLNVDNLDVNNNNNANNNNTNNNMNNNDINNNNMNDRILDQKEEEIKNEKIIEEEKEKEKEKENNNNNNNNQTMLGETQKQWLKNLIEMSNNSLIDFHIFLCGTTMFTQTLCNVPGLEKWPKSDKEFFIHLLKDNNILKKSICFSGDIHCSTIFEENGLYEIITSSMTHSVGEMAGVCCAAMLDSKRSKITVIDHNNFIVFDLFQHGWKVQYVDKKGEILLSAIYSFEHERFEVEERNEGNFVKSLF